MPKLIVRTRDEAERSSLPSAYAGAGGAAAYYAGEEHPLHLHLIELRRGEALQIAAGAVDQLAYVWRGAIRAGGRRLDAGSSLIVEHGASLGVEGAAESSVVLAFAAARPPAAPRAGGHVHLLPAEHAPRTDALGGVEGLGGVMHADADCPSCELWLHENRFAGRQAPPQGDEAGVHCHSEDEIIFVVEGDLRLGDRLLGPGAALAIAAEAFYSFSPGPDGLRFVNFRAGKPSDIRFKKGPAISETAYWRERLPRPEYLSPQE
jgi:hypothetical protein